VSFQIRFGDFLEATMTTVEFYYLAVCISAISVFGISLAYNAWSWKRSRPVADIAPEQTQVYPKSQTKLAA
jgi:hypothetical protein